MNLSTYMLNGVTKSPNSDLTLSGCKAVEDLTALKLAKFTKSLMSTIKNYWRHGMGISAVELEVPKAENVRVTKDTLSVDLSDGKTISVPLEWFPRLVHATQEERHNWRLIGKGHGIHWEDIDEDISIEGLLAGRSSGESQTSFKKWLNRRRTKC